MAQGNLDLVENILDDEELAQIEKFASNEKMVQAVRKILLFGVYNNGVLKPGKTADPAVNFMLNTVLIGIKQCKTDEMIGSEVRSQVMGIQLLEGAFDIIEQLTKKEEEIKKPEPNPAI